MYAYASKIPFSLTIYMYRALGHRKQTGFLCVKVNDKTQFYFGKGKGFPQVPG